MPADKISPGEKNLTEIARGDRINGMTVTTVFCASNNYVIFEHTAGFGWISNNIDREKIQEHMARMNTLLSQVHRWVPKELRHSLYSEMAFIWKRCLDQYYIPPGLDIFDGMAKHLQSHAVTRARYLYTVSATVATILVAIIALVSIFSIPHTYPMLILAMKGAASGSMGALLSVLMRSSQSQVDPHGFEMGYIIKGASRVIMGIIFGGFAVCAIVGGVLFSFAKDNSELIVVMALASGFCERAIPEAIHGIASVRE
jgi:hypothetical protein